MNVICFLESYETGVLVQTLYELIALLELRSLLTSRKQASLRDYDWQVLTCFWLATSKGLPISPASSLHITRLLALPISQEHSVFIGSFFFWKKAVQRKISVNSFFSCNSSVRWTPQTKIHSPPLYLGGNRKLRNRNLKTRANKIKTVYIYH